MTHEQLKQQLETAFDGLGSGRKVKIMDAIIQRIANKVLCWKLPKTFRPDCGISFQPKHSIGTPYESEYEPTGTNLLDAKEAEDMIRAIAGEELQAILKERDEQITLKTPEAARMVREFAEALNTVQKED